jgi:hypothetical protein
MGRGAKTRLMAGHFKAEFYFSEKSAKTLGVAAKTIDQ